MPDMARSSSTENLCPARRIYVPGYLVSKKARVPAGLHPDCTGLTVRRLFSITTSRIALPGPLDVSDNGVMLISSRNQQRES